MAALALTPRDCTDVEVVNITVEQPRAEPEKKARRTSWKLRRQLSVFGHERRAEAGRGGDGGLTKRRAPKGAGKYCEPAKGRDAGAIL